MCESLNNLSSSRKQHKRRKKKILRKSRKKSNAVDVNSNLENHEKGDLAAAGMEKEEKMLKKNRKRAKSQMKDISLTVNVDDDKHFPRAEVNLIETHGPMEEKQRLNLRYQEKRQNGKRSEQIKNKASECQKNMMGLSGEGQKNNKNKGTKVEKSTAIAKVENGNLKPAGLRERKTAVVSYITRCEAFPTLWNEQIEKENLSMAFRRLKQKPSSALETMTAKGDKSERRNDDRLTVIKSEAAEEMVFLSGVARG